jgi:hypothetical protein
VLVVAAQEMAPGGLADLHRGRRVEQPGVGAAADAVGAEILCVPSKSLETGPSGRLPCARRAANVTRRGADDAPPPRPPTAEPADRLDLSPRSPRGSRSAGCWRAGAIEPVLAVAGPVGSLWLRALQMTIIPLVAALLVTGIARMVATARAGAMARRTLAGSSRCSRAARCSPRWRRRRCSRRSRSRAAPRGARGGQRRGAAGAGIGAFFETLVAPNVVAAAAETAMLPLVVFFAALALRDCACPRRSARSCSACSRRSAKRCWW